MHRADIMREEIKTLRVQVAFYKSQRPAPKKILYVEDLIDVLENRNTSCLASYLNTTERVVDHPALLQHLHRLLEEK